MAYYTNINIRTIENYGYDLATQDNLCDLVGRKEELKKITKIVAIKGKSVILLGEPGCGKTSIVEKMALDIREGNNQFLKRKTIFYLNPAQMVAGTKYRGEFEERMVTIAEFCKRYKGDIILFIDEVHTLKGLGSSDGSVDAMNILKPYISSGDITIIGATTKDEYETYLAKDPAFVRRLENVEISTPNKKMTIMILNKYIEELCDKYGIDLSFDDNVKMQYLERIFNITDGKCAYITGDVKIENPTLSKNILENAFAEVVYNGGRKLMIEDIEMAMAEYSNLSLEFISKFGFDLSKQSNLCNLVGREKEVEKVIKAVAIQGKSVLLLGESGTGKTSIVEKIALDIRNNKCKFLNDKVIFSVNVASLTSDTKYRGDFEKNMNKLINWCRKNKGKIILFIDEIHMLWGLGRTSEGSVDAMNILKPYISNGDITIIGATTKKEYDKYFTNDPAFSRRLENIEVVPLTDEEKVGVLTSYSNDLSLKYNINLDLDKLSIIKVMQYIVKITDLKYQTNMDDIKVENPTISKSVLENAFTSAIYLSKGCVTIEDICLAIIECDKLPIEFRKDCAYELKQYLTNRDIVEEIAVPRLVRKGSIGFNV